MHSRLVQFTLYFRNTVVFEAFCKLMVSGHPLDCVKFSFYSFTDSSNFPPNPISIILFKVESFTSFKLFSILDI